MNYKERFIDVVVDHSVSNNWETAKTEWKHECSNDEPGSNCICGQSITDVCTIRNTINNNTLRVGNVCVNKFLDIDRRSDFKLIKNDLIDQDLLDELQLNKIITIKDLGFYQDIKLKRKLSYKQLSWKNKILLKAKQYVTKSGKGIVDQHAFKNLKTENMNIKQENRDQLGRFIAQQGMRISKSKHELSFTEVFDILKETLIQIKKLEKSYEV